MLKLCFNFFLTPLVFALAPSEFKLQVLKQLTGIIKMLITMSTSRWGILSTCLLKLIQALPLLNLLLIARQQLPLVCNSLFLLSLSAMHLRSYEVLIPRICSPKLFFRKLIHIEFIRGLGWQLPDATVDVKSSQKSLNFPGHCLLEEARPVLSNLWLFIFKQLLCSKSRAQLCLASDGLVEVSVFAS